MSEVALVSDDLLVSHVAGGLAVVRINRPRKRNAMSLAMWRSMASIFADLSADKAVRSIVLTGSGGAFCAGADISEFASVRSTLADGAVYEHAVESAEQAIIGSSKPTIAAISGACVGGGLGLALCCDFRIADASAYFAIPAARLSIVYGVTETRQLVSAVGLTRAKEILFTGRRFTMPEASEVGLVTQPVVVDVEAAALAFGRSFANSAPLTIAGAKLVLGALAEANVSARSAAIVSAIEGAILSRDYREGIAAFAAKRDPQFKGE